MIKGLFPMPLGIYEIGREYTKDELECLDNPDLLNNIGNKSSTKNDVLNLPSMGFVKQFIEESIDDYVAQTYDFENNAKLHLTQSWANITKSGGHHHTHTHQNSIVSGTLYLKGNENDIINFYDPVSNGMMNAPWHFPPKEFNDYNSKMWWMPATVGTLYLWPSSVMHGVPKVEGKKNRYSLSFNTFISGTIGSEHDLTQITIKE